jgi:hypothetical protein
MRAKGLNDANEMADMDRNDSCIPSICAVSTRNKFVEALYIRHFSDDLQIVKVDPLASGITERTVETINGVRSIAMTAGLRVMFAYPDTDFYANVKVESLPENEYPELKNWLIENFDYILDGSKDTKRNTSIQSPLKNFDVRGLDRSKLEGGVLGIYLVFDDKAHVVTTIYLLNQEPDARKFQTIEQYQQMRDTFLKTYLSCVRLNQQLQAWAEKK